MGYGGRWIDDVCSNTMLQRNCYDAYSLKNEIAFFKRQRNTHSVERTQYIEEYVVSNLIDFNGKNMYYLSNNHNGNGYFEMPLPNSRRQKKNKRNKNKKKQKR